MAINLTELEKQASSNGLLLRLQSRRPMNLWAVKVIVAKYIEPKKIRIYGEMKGWAYKANNGFQLDTMRVAKEAPKGLGHLIWASTMAWALEQTSCKRARLLAIRDDEIQHERLVNYFIKRGFNKTKEIGSSITDLPLRLVWGGAGQLMVADCEKVLSKSYYLWRISNSIHSSSA